MHLTNLNLIRTSHLVRPIDTTDLIVATVIVSLHRRLDIRWGALVAFVYFGVVQVARELRNDGMGPTCFGRGDFTRRYA
jgi:hypothetical protein